MDPVLNSIIFLGNTMRYVNWALGWLRRRILQVTPLSRYALSGGYMQINGAFQHFQGFIYPL
jgi:hypothetical protein